MEYLLNEYQTPIEDLHLEAQSQEVQEKFFEFFYNVPLIQEMINPNRPRAKDLPKDDKGRIIVDITKPHIIEDSDYFRQSALTFLKTGKYTELRPNSNPNSEYGKWIREEVRRCHEGYVRESDGEWIPGDYYFFLNYCPMLLAEKTDKNSKKSNRVLSFPRFWDGHYLKFHYLEQARRHGKHAIELASRQKGKSFCAAAMLTKRFILGESAEVNKKVTSYATAAEKGYLVKGDQTLDKFQYNIDFLAQHTEFPRKRLISTIQNMQWVMGYQDLDTGARKGTLNAVMGVTSKDDESKLRGTRGVLYILEEAGSFPRLLELWGNLLPSVEDGDDVYGLLFGYGTSGDAQSDFYAMAEMMYHPDGYHVYGTDNVYDLQGKASTKFAFFFPGYMNRAHCYDEDGNSDVTKALYEIILDRNLLKYNSTDTNSVTKRTAEIPIVPQEAILRTVGNLFPVTQLSERVGELDATVHAYDDVYVGTLVSDSNGNISFTPTADKPIRNFPLKDNKDKGALEIYNMPEKDNTGKVFSNRYVVGLDPVNNDQADTVSLMSAFVLDLFTDKIVAEYTGRTDFADDGYELVRKLCLFYNCKCLYENNAHPYSQLVRLPDGGFKLWKDVQVGDVLLAPGGTTKVIDIPVHKEVPIYKITLRDGRIVYASDNHIWKVYKIHNSNVIQQYTTKQMFDIGIKNKYKQTNFFIPNAGVVDYPTKEVPIDSYTLGLMIAEGSIRGSHCKKNYVQVSSSFEDADFYKTVIPYNMKHIGKSGYSWHVYIPNCSKICAELGLLGTRSETKFIPDLYLYNSVNVRLELLKGLMDGDGCATKGGASIYITTSKQLQQDIMLLCRSLGINCRYCKKKGVTQQGKQGADVYRITIYTNQTIFKLPRKIQKQYVYQPTARGSKATSYIDKTAITNIEFSHYEMGKCVTVDRADGLYLIGDYIVTHNCKGPFAYFSSRRCLHLLADTPEYLIDKQIIKTRGFGNTSKGVAATLPINNYANQMIRDWLLKPVTITVEEDGEYIEKVVPNLSFIKNRALLRELIDYNSEGNFDRVRSLGTVMLYRGEYLDRYEGDLSKINQPQLPKKEDDYFIRNYDSKFSKTY